MKTHFNLPSRSPTARLRVDAERGGAAYHQGRPVLRAVHHRGSWAHATQTCSPRGPSCPWSFFLFGGGDLKGVNVPSGSTWTRELYSPFTASRNDPIESWWFRKTGTGEISLRKIAPRCPKEDGDGNVTPRDTQKPSAHPKTGAGEVFGASFPVQLPSSHGKPRVLTFLAHGNLMCQHGKPKTEASKRHRHILDGWLWNRIRKPFWQTPGSGQAKSM